MAFLDNSGDIILDAVLTDAGRQRLSRGNFKIVKFALGDEEINYSIFNGSHPSGSAFYDLEVMQTPVLESFTNNTSLMKSKLITMTRNNILYMPVFKLNDLATGALLAKTHTDLNFDNFILLADTKTEKNEGPGANVDGGHFNLRAGLLRGASSTLREGDQTKHIALDQGIDSSEGGLSFRQNMPDDLVETAFLIKMDHRLIELGAVAKNQKSISKLTNQFVDDDGIATYYVVQGDSTTCVEAAPGRGATQVSDDRDRASVISDNPDKAETAASFNEVFDGPLGSILRLGLKSSMHLRQSAALFNELGTTVTSGSDLQIGPSDIAAHKIVAYKYIDTMVNVVGVTTGYSLDIPIRIVKKS